MSDDSYFSFVLLSTILAILLFVLWDFSKPQEKTNISSSSLSKPVRQAIPPFRLPPLWRTDKTFSHEDLKNHVSLLNIWASWCAACRHEHAMLLQIHKNSTAPLYSINYKDNPSAARALLLQAGDPYVKSGLDRGGILGNILGIYFTPEMLLIDKKGVIRFRHAGVITQDVWEKDFIPLIKQLENE